MRSVEGEGATIDDAIARALAALGVARDQAEIDILWNSSRGVLGFGRRKARVRATVRARLEMAASTLGDAGEGAARDVAEPAEPSREESSRRDRTPTERAPAPGATTEVAPAQASSTGVDAATVLREILSALRLTVSVTEDDGASDARVLLIEGPDRALAIGRRGEVMEALEYLVNRIGERAGGVARRVVLDAEGFREQRTAGLEARARALAERARARRKPVATGALSPSDRRALHRALESESGIVARSVGRGFYRKLVVIPEGARRGGGKATQ